MWQLVVWFCVLIVVYVNDVNNQITAVAVTGIKNCSLAQIYGLSGATLTNVNRLL